MNTITTHSVISRGIQTFGLVVCIALTVCFARVSGDGWIPRIACAFSGFVGVLLLFFRETRIDVDKRFVMETCRLLGLILVWWRERPFDEFRGIECYCSSDLKGDDISSTWQVALRPLSDPVIEVRQFYSKPGERSLEAEAFARELSRQTGLELIDREDR
jgi:hypothetical protein